MPAQQLGAALRHIQCLFDSGTLAGLSDAQLLDRFLERRDESAFAALVDRHGPLVLATCRAVLRDPDAAEDAFQATFLLLVKKAGSIRDHEALGAWLHRVSRRVAIQANTVAVVRREHERRAAALRAVEVAGDRPWDELDAILHEEIDRLPDRQRLPLVLCHLEELAHAQAACQLRWSERTLRRRLAEAREHLRSRLNRRGVALTAGALASALARQASAVPLPESWAVAAGRVVGGGASLSASALVQAVLRTLLLSRLKMGLSALAAIACLSAGLLIAVAGRSGGAGPPDDPPGVGSSLEPKALPPPDREEPATKRQPDEMVEIRGRVVDHEGKPVSEAALRLSVFVYQWIDGPEPRTTSGTDGRFALQAPRRAFEVTAPRGDVQSQFVPHVAVIASAPGFGPDWAMVENGPDAPKDVTLRLVEDSLPIEGRVLDLEGRPVAGAVFATKMIGSPPAGGLSPWIEEMKAGYGRLGRGYGLERCLPWELTATTGPDGRFRLEGVGRERFVIGTLSGPTIQTSYVRAMTRDLPAFSAQSGMLNVSNMLLIHGARFDYAAAPGRAITGVIRDQDTGKPLAGIRVNGSLPHEGFGNINSITNSITDDQGRYQLFGLPKADKYRLTTVPVSVKGQPYLPISFEVPIDNPGLGPATFDMRMKRCPVPVRGRLVDKTTGKSVRGTVSYYPFADNPHVKELSRHFIDPKPVDTDADGRFEVPALPGHGLIAARADSLRYMVGVGAETIARTRTKGRLPTLPSNVIPNSLHVLAEINPEVEAESLTCDLSLITGRTVSGTVVDPDGKPISPTIAERLFLGEPRLHPPLESATFEVTGLDPPFSPRRIYFFHPERKLAGSVLVNGDEPGPITVRLQPWGIVTGRLLDDEGTPRTKVELRTGRPIPFADPERGLLLKNYPVDQGGRFRIEVVPGLKYEAIAVTEAKALGKVFEDLKLEPGEVKDLGDIRVKPLPGN